MKFLKYILIILSAILFIRGMTIFMAEQAIAEAKDARESADFELTLANYKLAKFLNPYDSLILKSLAEVYYQLSFSGDSGKDRENINLAEENILASFNLEKNNWHYHEFYSQILKRKIELNLGKIEESELKKEAEKMTDELEKAIFLNPSGAYLSYRGLIESAFLTKNYQKVLDLTEQFSSFYPAEVFNSIIWINPNKDKIQESLKINKSFAGVSSLMLGKIDKAKEYFLNSQKDFSCKLLEAVKLEEKSLKEAEEIKKSLCL